MRLDLEARLIGKTLVLNRSQDPNVEDIVELIYLNEPIELRRNQVKDLGPTINEGEVIDESINYEITNDKEYESEGSNEPEPDNDFYFSQNIEINNFEVVGNMDIYRDEGMGEVIFEIPLLLKVCVTIRRFLGEITIDNGIKSVTYHMENTLPSLKHLTNAQCNVLPPLLLISVEDKLNGIMHQNQKRQPFFKGVLDLGHEYIRDDAMERWLTYEHRRN
ncbi:hypothetical protein Tco_0428113 [Tanacetum coccineum]